MTKKTIINKIKRQQTLSQSKVNDMYEYDKIVAMEWDGIPGLKDEEYYVEYVDTTGRDIMQQSVNVYAVQKPKWDVLPRGTGDIKTAEEFERVIEWYFAQAAQMGRKPFSSEIMTHIGKYNMACSQLEWQDDYSFCVKNYRPHTVRYEYGAKLQWVAVVDNVYAVDILQRWDEYRDHAATSDVKALGNGFGLLGQKKIGAALDKIQKLVDDDEEQRMMYIDYTDNKTRYTVCYPTTREDIDEELGFDDDGKESAEFIVIQDKDNSLGFINWAITENEGDPLLAPLLKGQYYNNINDLLTLEATNLFRTAMPPMFLQEGRPDADIDIDFKGSQVVAKVPTGAKAIPFTPSPPNQALGQMVMDLRSRMNQSMSVQNVSQVQVSNVQNATLDSQIKLWLMQYEPNKRTAEKHYEQLAKLMLMWAKKKEKVLKATRTYSKPSIKSGDEFVNRDRGSEIMITADQINLDALYIKCRILANNPTDMMERINEINIIRQTGLPIDAASLIEELDRGDPDMMREKFEREQIRDATLKAKTDEIIKATDVAIQMQMAQFQAQLQVQSQQALQAMQQPQPTPGTEPATQSQPLPSDAMMQGDGANAAIGGQAPQAATPGITQGMR